MTAIDVSRPRSASADYATVRTTVGVYPVTAPLVRVAGDDRLALLDQFLAKAGEFVDPDTVRESVALHADGSPFAILLHLELEEESWLLARTPLTAAELSDYLGDLDVPDGVTVEVGPQGWGATAFEGPQAWAVAANFVDFDISGLTLHAVTPFTAPDMDDAIAHLARVGTTGEYGYLVISDAPAAVHDAVLSHAASVDGAAIGVEGLARVQAEAGQGVYHHGFDGLSVNEADLAWMIDWNRLGEFRGSADLEKPTERSAKLTMLVGPAGTTFTAGSAVTAGGVTVGTLAWQTPSTGGDEEMVAAVLESPLWVPGLDLTTTDADGAPVALRTVTQPRVIAKSLYVRIG